MASENSAPFQSGTAVNKTNYFRTRRARFLICFILASAPVLRLAPRRTFAEEPPVNSANAAAGNKSVATSQPGDSPTTAPSESAQPTSERRKMFTSRASGTGNDSLPPDYVIQASEYAKWFGEENADAWEWLDIGMEQRSRYEKRDDFFIANQESSDHFLMRNRAYIGIREILDPVRFAFEFQDSRVMGADFPFNNNNINENELTQAILEFYFKDAFGPGEPLSIRTGRMNFDIIDRRLFGRQGFRNSTNSYDGIRIRAGDESTKNEFNLFAVRPVERLLRQPDRPDEERWLLALTGAFRGLNPNLTLEPYYFMFDEDRKGLNQFDRELHTFGLHAYGLIGDSGFDYDLNFMWQTGKSRRQNHRALAAHAEAGYTFKHEFKPRLAFFADYASGDRNPNDRTNERFDRLFGNSHSAYGYSDSFILENFIQAAMRLTLQPTEKLRIEGFFRNYWLASDSDSWGQTGRRDRTGRSGDFIGHGFDIMAVYQVTKKLSVEVGYAHLTVGDFIANTAAKSDDSDFFYVQTRLKL